MDDRAIEVYKQHRETQDRNARYFLTASAASIAFAITQTQDAVIAWSMIPLGAAVLCWGLSFYCGCRYLAYVESMLYSNMEILLVQRGGHPEVGRHPGVIEDACSGIQSAMNKNSQAAVALARHQFRLLTAGAVFFIVWHVVAMSTRGPQAVNPGSAKPAAVGGVWAGSPGDASAS